MNGRAIVIRQDIVLRIEGEYFVAYFGNLTQFVVFEMGCSRRLIGTVGQVTAGMVVAVAKFNSISRCYCVLPVLVCIKLLSVAICFLKLPYKANCAL